MDGSGGIRRRVNYDLLDKRCHQRIGAGADFLAGIDKKDVMKRQRRRIWKCNLLLNIPHSILF
jgi:hypothetical protein